MGLVVEMFMLSTSHNFLEVVVKDVHMHAKVQVEMFH